MNALDVATTGRVHDIPETLLACRSYGHGWKPNTVKRVPQRRQFVVSLVCVRCDTHRLRLLSETGAILANRYEYPAGYCIEGGRLDQEERDLIRLRALLTMLNH